MHVSLLPSLDQGDVFQQVDFNEDGSGLGNSPPTSKANSTLVSLRLPVFLCPSDPSPILGNSYRVSAGTSPGRFQTALGLGSNESKRGFADIGGRRLARVKDGLSQTVAMSEKLAGDGIADDYSPVSDTRAIPVMRPLAMLTPDDARRTCALPDFPQPNHFSHHGATWLLNGYSQTLFNHVLPPNDAITDCSGFLPESPGAFTARSHHGGVNCLIADGSVRFVSDEISSDVWRALGTIDHSDIASGEF